MALKKQHFAEGEIAIFDEACIYKRGEYWQFRMWLPKENKYARKSLRIHSEVTAIEKGKAAYLEIYANLQRGKTRNKDSDTHCSCSKDKDSQARTTAAKDTKRHGTNGLYTYSSTTTVTKSTRRQRKTLGNQSKVHGL